MKIPLRFCALIFCLVLTSVRPDDLEDYTDTNVSDYVDLENIPVSASDFELAENALEQEFGLNESVEAESSGSGGFGFGSVLRGLLGISSAHAAETIESPPPKHRKVTKTDTFGTLLGKHQELDTILGRYRMDSMAVQVKEKLCKFAVGPAKVTCVATMKFMLARCYVRVVYTLVKHGWTKHDIVQFLRLTWGNGDHPLFPNIQDMRIFQRTKKLKANE